MDSKTETVNSKKTNTGKIGFVLSILVLPALILSIGFCFLGPLSLVLFGASLFCCIHALIKTRSRKLASIGLLVNIFIIVLLFFVSIEFTPPGSMPYPLNIYKFKRVCPEATFWLNFDNSNLEEVKSGIAFLSPYASVYFKRNSGQYSKDAVIEFTEKNGWKYHLTIPITSKNLHLFDTSNQNLSSDELEFQTYIVSSNPIPISFNHGSQLLVFETTNYLGYASFILLSNDSNELRIYYQNPTLPEHGEDFWLPDLFYKLSEENNKETQ